MYAAWHRTNDDGCAIAQQYADRLRLAEACDRLGFYAYHLAVHHFTPQGGRRRICSCRAPHSAQGNFVVARWSLLSLHHPLRAFEEICMLDHLSGGSVEMGIGRGSLPIKLGHFGIDADDVPERYLEASEILMAAMKGGTLFYRGHHFPL
ncbi:LLM class flavin-dependent oxidoreductase, partial [Paraburkholderia mimosarum]